VKVELEWDTGGQGCKNDIDNMIGLLGGKALGMPTALLGEDG
jgi:hypothetical protein